MPDIERLKWRVCRSCGAVFAFDYDTEQHAMQTGHKEFEEKDLDSEPNGERRN